jgi:Transposase DDE domain group 1
LRVDFQDARVTSDGSLPLVRELDERLGFGELIERHLTDWRAKNTQLPLTDLMRQSVYGRLADYEDVNDAERLSQDPAFRLIGSEKVLERGAALTSRVQSFETELSRHGKAIDRSCTPAGFSRLGELRPESVRQPRKSAETSVQGQRRLLSFGNQALFSVLA